MYKKLYFSTLNSIITTYNKKRKNLFKNVNLNINIQHQYLCHMQIPIHCQQLLRRSQVDIYPFDLKRIASKEICKIRKFSYCSIKVIIKYIFYLVFLSKHSSIKV